MRTTLKSWPLVWRGLERTYDVRRDKLPWTLEQYLRFAMRSKAQPKPSKNQILDETQRLYGGSRATLLKFYHQVKAAEGRLATAEDLADLVEAVPVETLRTLVKRIASHWLVTSRGRVNADKEVNGSTAVDFVSEELSEAGLWPR